MRRLIRPFLVFALVISGCAGRGPFASGEGAESALPRGVATTFPALVQIFVIVATPEGGRLAKEQAAGSGVIISAEGHVVTNHHVVGHAVAVRCLLADRREVEAEIVGSDALADIAVLRLRLPAGVPVPAVAAWDEAPLRAGQRVYALGCPLALAQSVTTGIVSNTTMTLPRFFGGAAAFTLDGEAVGSLVTWIMHDAVIFPGNSGGPLVDEAGRIVGINEIGIGLGGAIPAAIARPVAEALMREGRVRRAWYGLGMRPLLRDQPGDLRGALVEDVRAGSPADAAGIRRGDVLAAVDGIPVSARRDEELPAVARVLLGRPIGQPSRLELLRDGRPLMVTATPLERDDAEGRPRDLPTLGVIVRRLTRDEAARFGRADTAGALVIGRRNGGPAAAAQPPLENGDIIEAVDGAAVADDAALAERCRERSGPLLLIVARRDERIVARVEAGLRQPARPAAGVRRAAFPASVQAVTPLLAQALGLPVLRGVRVTALRPGAPADLRVGDIITTVDGQPLDIRQAQDAAVFRDLIAAYDPGTRVALGLRRGAETIALTLALPAREAEAAEVAGWRDHRLEVSVRDVVDADRRRLHLPDAARGALVVDADAGGWAAVGGLRADDLVVDVDGRAVAGADDLRQVLDGDPGARRRSAVTVRRGHLTAILEIERPTR